MGQCSSALTFVTEAVGLAVIVRDQRVERELPDVLRGKAPHLDPRPRVRMTALDAGSTRVTKLRPDDSASRPHLDDYGEPVPSEVEMRIIGVSPRKGQQPKLVLRSGRRKVPSHPTQGGRRQLP